jgi:polysaccharide deacetylase family protein (PEP-CTERM system associated)
MRPVGVHHFSVDVEEYFQVCALEGVVPRATWPDFESRVGASVDLLLELMSDHGARGTFFVLGWLADRNPGLVHRIWSAGHEIASHGWDHRRVKDQAPSDFRLSVRRSKALLEDLTGERVLGFRAPSFSIVRGCEWALDILLEEGYFYDSSLFPVRRPGYGYANGQRDPHWVERPGGRLGQAPPATLTLGTLRIPAAGGAYFRLLPYRLVQTALREAERRGAPATFYIHPWELDPGQPRIATAPWTSARHYGGLSRTVPRLERLLGEFRFRPIGETMAEL